HSHLRYTEALSESEDSGGGHWKSRSKKKKSSEEEDDLSQPLVCEETDPFTPQIRYFDFPKTRMPSHIKTYDGKRWAMPTWCHMFNSTLTGNARVWFDDFPPESIDSYDNLKKAFLENYLQQKKHIKDPIELHNIKQRDGESAKDFVRKYNVPRYIAEHRLNMRKGCSPVRQKKRGQAADRNQAIQKEVGKLMGAGIMREVHCHDWLSNPVMVKNMTEVGGSEEAFKQMKQLIAELPILTTPMEKEELIVYIAAVKETVSTVLRTEREAKQMPIYFVSRALRGLKLNYTSMEKLVMVLVHASKHLKRPRVSVKGHILAEFIVERPEEDSLSTPMEEEDELPEPWILFTDGSSCTDGSRARLILTTLEGMEFTYALRFRFDATNNEAEYEALIAGLRIAEQMGVKNLHANVDSRLVANQVNGTYVAKEADIIRYLEKVKALTASFRAFSIKQIPRSENKKYDAPSKIASTSFVHLSKQVLVKELKEKSIGEIEILAVVEEEGDTWMTPLFKYLAEGTLPADVKKARAIRCKSWRFAVINETLYKKSFLCLWLRCVGPLQANYVLSEIHKGSCSMHAGTRSVVAKALRIGYYWPTMHQDTRTLIRAYELPHVLCAHQTKIKSSNRDIPFSLTYEIEVVIPAEIRMPTLRTAEVDLVGNNEALEINLDLLEESREEAAIHEAKRKLGPKWEGPYEVTEALGKGAYMLRGRDGKQLSRT
nr:reverse transcriptase domain-containing protein [Tanacetum cinerariifolium]